MNSDQDKGYSLRMEHLDPYLYVTVTGARVTGPIALDYWAEIITECDRLKCSKILLEHDFTEMISMPEMLEIIGPVTDMLKGRMMAFYDSYGHYEIPDAAKMIMRAQNVRMQIFHDLSRERWLLAN